MLCPSLPVLSSAIKRSSAASAMRAPPLSAVFSPNVSRPLSFMLSTATKFEYSSATQLTRFSNSFPSCVVHALIKEWWLQNARRKHDLVVRPAVVRVHLRRSHAPLLAVQRLVDFR